MNVHERRAEAIRDLERLARLRLRLRAEERKVSRTAVELGVVPEAARILGCGRQTIYNRARGA